MLSVVDVERPTPDDDDEVLVAVEAAAVNPVDTYFREGAYEPASVPWTPGSEADCEEGDRVFATGLGNWLQGTCAEYAVLPASMLARLPIRSRSRRAQRWHSSA